MKYEALRDVEQRVNFAVYDDVIASLHFHRSIELVYVLEGELTATVGANNFVVHENEIVFVPSYFAHSITPIQKTRSITFIIPYNYFDVFIKQNYELYFFLLPNKNINLQIKEMIMLASLETEVQPNILLRGYIEIILGLIVKNYKVIEHEKEDNNLMIEIIDYVDKNFADDLTLSVIAKHFKYSKCYFSRLFNKYFGCNLNHYINNVRMNYVFENQDKENKISSVILDAGFNNLSTFYKMKGRSEK